MLQLITDTIIKGHDENQCFSLNQLVEIDSNSSNLDALDAWKNIVTRLLGASDYNWVMIYKPSSNINESQQNRQKNKSSFQIEISTQIPLKST